MKKQIIVFFVLCSLLISPAVGIRDYGNHPMFLGGYNDLARVYLKKSSLASCFRQYSHNKNIKQIFTGASSYYFHIKHMYLNSESIAKDDDAQYVVDVNMDILNPYVNKKMIDMKPADDVEVIESCLKIYHSNEYQKLVKTADRFIDNYGFEQNHYPFELPYIKLNPLQQKIADIAFYECLHDVISDESIKRVINQKMSRDKLNLVNTEDLDILKNKYHSAFKKYTLSNSLRSISDTTNLTCIVMYDSYALNKLIVDSF